VGSIYPPPLIGPLAASAQVLPRVRSGISSVSGKTFPNYLKSQGANFLVIYIQMELIAPARLHQASV
jgi:hypothetical protein